MAGIKMKNKGVILARLSALPDQVRELAQKQLEAEGAALVERMRAAVPVKTGRLRDSIQVREGDRPLKIEIVAGGEATTVKVRKGVQDSDFASARRKQNNTGEYDYSRAVEFGHITPEDKHVPARPYFYPSYRLSKAGIKRRIAAAVRKGLKSDLLKPPVTGQAE